MASTVNRPAVDVAPDPARPGLALVLALLAIPGSTIAWELPSGGLWIGLPLGVAALVLGLRARRRGGHRNGHGRRRHRSACDRPDGRLDDRLGAVLGREERMSTTRNVPALGALALVAASLVLGACGGDDEGPAAAATPNKLAITASEAGKQSRLSRPQVGAGRPCDRRADEHGQGVSRGPAHSPRPRPHARRGVEGNRRRRGTQPGLDPRRRRHRPRTAAWRARRHNG